MNLIFKSINKHWNLVSDICMYVELFRDGCIDVCNSFWNVAKKKIDWWLEERTDG